MSKDIFVSIRGRILLNVEALNMTESVGNYVKHRRVPVMLQLQNGFVVNFVPAISGESIAHGFQKVLVDEALKNNLPVCKLCKSGIFLKSTDDKVVKEAFELKDEKEFKKDKESFIIRNCIVEDVGGFLYAEKENVKRTSNFYVGYMIPTKEALESTVIEPQLHSRYALGTSFVKDQEQTKGQMIYYVELSSTLYTFSFDLDTRYIGKITFNYEDVGKLAVKDEKDRINRIITTLEALKKFLIELPFGAKKSRFLPTGEWNSLVIAVSDDVWTVGSPFTAKYIENTNKKLEKINYNTELFIYDGNKETIEEIITNAIDEAKSRVNQSK